MRRTSDVWLMEKGVKGRVVKRRGMNGEGGGGSKRGSSRCKGVARAEKCYVFRGGIEGG